MIIKRITWIHISNVTKRIFEPNNEYELTHYKPVLPSYRNQPIELLYKSIDWFLFGGNTGI